MLRHYKITLDEFNNILISQNYKCKICDCYIGGKEEKKVNRDKVCIDHNHKTGKVRGLLCNTCNRALGLFKDNLEILKKAVNYIEFEEKNNGRTK